MLMKPPTRGCTPPTLLTSTSMRPWSSIACATRRPGPSGATRSTAYAVTRSRFASVWLLRGPATPRAPSAASWRATARPMPLLSPVTTATFASSSRAMQRPYFGRAGSSAVHARAARGRRVFPAVDLRSAGGLEDASSRCVADRRHGRLEAELAGERAVYAARPWVGQGLGRALDRVAGEGGHLIDGDGRVVGQVDHSLRPTLMLDRGAWLLPRTF